MRDQRCDDCSEQMYFNEMLEERERIIRQLEEESEARLQEIRRLRAIIRDLERSPEDA